MKKLFILRTELCKTEGVLKVSTFKAEASAAYRELTMFDLIRWQEEGFLVIIKDTYSEPPTMIDISVER